MTTRHLPSTPTPEYGAPFLPITSTRSTNMLKTISHEELTDEQRESLPDHLPADTELTVCLGCGSIRDQGPFGFDAWKNHEDECVPYAAGDDEDDEIPDGLDSWQPHELTGWLAAVEDNPTNSAEYVALARQAVGKALGVN